MSEAGEGLKVSEAARFACLVKLRHIARSLGGDPEAAHGAADRALLSLLRGTDLGDVADAYEECRDAVGFWYA